MADGGRDEDRKVVVSVLHGRRRPSIRVYGIPISSIALPSLPNLFKGSKLLYHPNFKLNEEGCAMSLHRRRLLCLAIAVACYLSPLPTLCGRRRLCVAVADSVSLLPGLSRHCRLSSSYGIDVLVERERGITVKAQGLEHVILAHSGKP
ncbi:hypothetical protein LXL04_035915 [Taraxacum kok-saghyz]